MPKRPLQRDGEAPFRVPRCWKPSSGLIRSRSPTSRRCRALLIRIRFRSGSSPRKPWPLTARADEAYWRDKKDETTTGWFNANQKTAFEAQKARRRGKDPETGEGTAAAKVLNAPFGGASRTFPCNPLMVDSCPLDDIYSRMAARECRDGRPFTKTFEGIGLAFRNHDDQDGRGNGDEGRNLRPVLPVRRRWDHWRRVVLHLRCPCLGWEQCSPASCTASMGTATAVEAKSSAPRRLAMASPERNGGGGGNTMHFHFAAGTRASDKGMLVSIPGGDRRERQRSRPEVS